MLELGMGRPLLRGMRMTTGKRAKKPASSSATGMTGKPLRMSSTEFRAYIKKLGGVVVDSSEAGKDYVADDARKPKPKA
jgi:hypothetical protein